MRTIFNQFDTDSAHHQVLIEYTTDNGVATIDNSSIKAESLVYTSALIPVGEARFGSCIADEFEIEVKIDTPTLFGKDITVKLKAGNMQDWYVLGVFKVYSDVKSDKKHRKVKSRDKMSLLLEKPCDEFIEDLTFPMTLGSLRNAIFGEITDVCSQDSVTLPLDSIMLSKPFADDTENEHTFGDLLGGICEVNGRFGKIVNGVFYYLYFSNAYIRSLNCGMYSELDVDDGETPGITQLQYKFYDGKDPVVVGTDGTSVVFKKNAISRCMQGITESQASSVLLDVENKPFRALTVETYGNPSYWVGDKIVVTDSDGTMYDSYITNRVIKGIQHMRDTITVDVCDYNTVNGVSQLEDDLITVKTDVKKNYASKSEIEKTNESIKAEVTARENLSGVVSKNTASIELLNNSISLKAEQSYVEGLENEINDLTKELDGNATVYYTDYDPTTTNYPAWDWTYNLICSDDETICAKCSETTKFEYKNEYWKKHTRTLVFNEDTKASFRFLKSGESYGWSQVTDTDFGIAMSKIAELEITTDEISGTVQEQGILIDSQGARLGTVESSLVQQASSITAKVSKADGNNSSNCSWVLDPSGFIVKSKGTEVLRVDQNGLTISGYTKSALDTISNNSSYAKDKADNIANGTTQINGGNIVTGSIHADSLNLTELKAKNIFLNADGVISWNNLPNNTAKTGDIPTSLSQLSNSETNFTTLGAVADQGYQNAEQVTQITKNTVTTSYVNALKVKAGSVDAENITGTTISGKIIEGCEIENSTSAGNYEWKDGQITLDELIQWGVFNANKIRFGTMSGTEVAVSISGVSFKNESNGTSKTATISSSLKNGVQTLDVSADKMFPSLIQSGRLSVGSTPKTVTFSKEFASVPNVVASFSTASNTNPTSAIGIIRIFQVDKRGFVIVAPSCSSVQDVSWIATV